MRLNEYKKIGKLSDEIITYFLKNNYHHINFDIAIEDERIILNIEINNIKAKEEKKIIESFDSRRNYSVEEYGWELLGESESSNELELVGMLFDRFYYEKEGTTGKIKLVRFI
ncbi:hypothetical protein [Mycoplasma sp. P36-A1]|uniref:hypothetical protein n=1 Tax=Mycoplasma sp. P36-A1 TaxID=3252900 RepID=UPI003C2B22A8